MCLYSCEVDWNQQSRNDIEFDTWDYNINTIFLFIQTESLILYRCFWDVKLISGLFGILKSLPSASCLVSLRRYLDNYTLILKQNYIDTSY